MLKVVLRNLRKLTSRRRLNSLPIIMSSRGNEDDVSEGLYLAKGLSNKDKLIWAEKTASRSVWFDKLLWCENTS